MCVSVSLLASLFSLFLRILRSAARRRPSHPLIPPLLPPPPSLSLWLVSGPCSRRRSSGTRREARVSRRCGCAQAPTRRPPRLQAAEAWERVEQRQPLQEPETVEAGRWGEVGAGRASPTQRRRPTFSGTRSGCRTAASRAVRVDPLPACLILPRCLILSSLSGLFLTSLDGHHRPPSLATSRARARVCHICAYLREVVHLLRPPPVVPMQALVARLSLP